MDEDPLINSCLNKQSSPRPLLECLEARSTHQQRKKNKIFQRNDSRKTDFLLNDRTLVFFSLLAVRNHEDQIDGSPGKV